MEPTKEQFDVLCQQVKDIAELQKKGGEDVAAATEAMVKQVLAAHPGRTAEQKIEFADNKAVGGAQYQILGRMPKELQLMSDELLWLGKIMKKPVTALKHYKRFRSEAGDFTKALDSTTAGGGDEWVPTAFSPELERLIRLEMKVAALFPEIPMPTNPYTLPFQVGRVSSYKQPEQTADTGQTKIPVGDGSSITGNTTFTAVGHAARVLLSKEVEEDSIVAVLQFLREEFITAISEGREDGILNGDTAGTHEDSDIAAIGATDRRSMWLGLRAVANDNSYTRDMSTFNTVNLRAMRADMGKYGVNPAQLAWVCSAKTYLNKFLGLAEVVTVDKYGAAATVLSGELAKFDGIPIIVSEWVRDVLDANGVYSASGTKSCLYLAHRRGHAWGDRRQPSVQLLQELYAESDQDALITKERRAFRDLHAIASNRTVNLGINV